MTDTSILSVIDLPLASVGRIVKTGIPNGSRSAHDPSSTKLSKEVKLAMSRAGGLFALYLANSSIESARLHGRQTVSGDDVIAALEEIEFDPLIEPCLTFLKQGKKTRSNKGEKGDKSHREKESTSKKSSTKSAGKSSKSSTNQSANQKKKAPVKRKAPAVESAASKKKKVEHVSEDDFEPVNDDADADAAEQEDEEELNDD